MKEKTVVLYMIDFTKSTDEPAEVSYQEYRGDSIKDWELLLKCLMRLGEDVEDFFGKHELDMLAQNNWQVLKVGRYVNCNNYERFFAILKYVYKNGNIKYRIICFDGTRKQFLDKSAIINEYDCRNPLLASPCAEV